MIIYLGQFTFHALTVVNMLVGAIMVLFPTWVHPYFFSLGKLGPLHSDALTRMCGCWMLTLGFLLANNPLNRLTQRFLGLMSLVMAIIFAYGHSTFALLSYPMMVLHLVNAFNFFTAGELKPLGSGYTVQTSGIGRAGPIF